MQDLARKTVELIRKWPILLLPLLGIDQITLYLDVLRRLASEKITIWSMTTTVRSVTGALIETPVSPTEARGRALLLVVPLQWATYFIRLALYTAAFVFAAYMVHGILAGARPSFREVLNELRANVVRILVFAAKFLAVGYAVSLAILLPTLPFNPFHHVPAYALQSIASAETIVETAIVVWIMTPVALRLLNSDLPSKLPADTKRKARLVCIICAIAVDVLSFGAQNLRFSPEILTNFDPWFWSYPVPSIESALVALPYILMWVALALLAFDEPMIEIPSPS